MKSENIDEGDYILCTGLFEKFDKDLNYYKKLFEKNLDKEMICTNPDLIVDRGNKRELCAGSVAMVFEKMGGKVVYLVNHTLKFTIYLLIIKVKKFFQSVII